MLTLDLAVVTYGSEGIKRVEKLLLDPIPGVSYVVSWQDHKDCPLPQSIANRSDVKVVRLEKKGISENRNNAMKHCMADIVLFVDDDMIYTPAGLKKIIETFEKHPDLDVGLFKVDFGNNKPYPAEEIGLKLPFPKNYWVSSVEIAYKNNRKGNLLCTPFLGIGSPLMGGGEDEFFVISCIKRNLQCRFFPLEIGSHPHSSTGDKVNDRLLRSVGFLTATVYPFTFGLRVLVNALRRSKTSGKNYLECLKPMMYGALMAKKNIREMDSCYKW